MLLLKQLEFFMTYILKCHIGVSHTRNQTQNQSRSDVVKERGYFPEANPTLWVFTNISTSGMLCLSILLLPSQVSDNPGSTEKHPSQKEPYHTMAPAGGTFSSL